MEKKLKEALIGYLRNAGELYSLYAEDSWTDDQFTIAAITDWTLNIMEECINDKDVVPVLKLIREVIDSGLAARELPYNDLDEKDDGLVFDSLMEKAEQLKSQISLEGDINGKERKRSAYFSIGQFRNRH